MIFAQAGNLAGFGEFGSGCPASLPSMATVYNCIPDALFLVKTSFLLSGDQAGSSAPIWSEPGVPLTTGVFVSGLIPVPSGFITYISQWPRTLDM